MIANSTRVDVGKETTAVFNSLRNARVFEKIKVSFAYFAELNVVINVTIHNVCFRALVSGDLVSLGAIEDLTRVVVGDENQAIRVVLFCTGSLEQVITADARDTLSAVVVNRTVLNTLINRAEAGGESEPWRALRANILVRNVN